MCACFSLEIPRSGLIIEEHHHLTVSGRVSIGGFFAMLSSMASVSGVSGTGRVLEEPDMASSEALPAHHCSDPTGWSGEFNASARDLNYNDGRPLFC
jgi:hypothetical protein